MPRVFSGLGSNSGDRETHLRRALADIGRIEKTRILEASSLYESEPWGYRDQDPFLNQVFAVETGLDPRSLLRSLQEIEAAHGRSRSGGHNQDGSRSRETKWGPRTIDIDILLFGDLVIQTPDLVVPHPYLMDRRFVLVPLAEIGPDVVIPGKDMTVAEALERCKDEGKVKLYEKAVVSGGSLREG